PSWLLRLQPPMCSRSADGRFFKAWQFASKVLTFGPRRAVLQEGRPLDLPMASNLRHRWAESRGSQLQEFWVGIVADRPARTATTSSPSVSSSSSFLVAPSRLKVSDCAKSLGRIVWLAFGVPFAMYLAYLPYFMVSNVYTLAFAKLLGFAVFMQFSAIVVHQCLGESATKLQQLISLCFCGAPQIVLAWCPCSDWGLYVTFASQISALVVPWLITILRLCREGVGLKPAWCTFGLLCLGGVPCFTGFGLYVTSVYVFTFASAEAELLCSMIWTMVPFLVKPMGTYLAPHAAPYEKGLAGSLFGVHVDVAIGFFGLPIFMRTLTSSTIYAASILPVLFLQYLRGLFPVFKLMPSALRASSELHLHRMLVILEVFGLLLGRVGAMSMYFCLKLTWHHAELSGVPMRFARADFSWEKDVGLGACSLVLLAVSFLVWILMITRTWVSGQAHRRHGSVAPSPAEGHYRPEPDQIPCRKNEESKGPVIKSQILASHEGSPEVAGDASAERPDEFCPPSILRDGQLVSRRLDVQWNEMTGVALRDPWQVIDAYSKKFFFYLSSVMAFNFVVLITLVQFGASIFGSREACLAAIGGGAP
ncbi:unnamed protein product, partial [Polarella glacialis]